MSLLIVEDGWATLEALEMVVNDVVPQHFPDFEENGHDVAKCYANAETMISQNTYGIVLLDHRMPKENPKGDAEAIGYDLIPMIRQNHPDAYIIGTSDSPLAQSKEHELDYTLDKMNIQKTQSQLHSILSQIDGRISDVMGYKKK